MTSEAARRVIIFDGQAWHVRCIRLIEHDLDSDEKVYRCDQPISSDHSTLAEVPEIKALAAEAVWAERARCIGIVDKARVKTLHPIGSLAGVGWNQAVDWLAATLREDPR